MSTAYVVFFLAAALAAACGAEAALVEHTFVVSQVKMHHMCNDSLVTLVNGQFPGPAIEVTEGDSVVVHVINKSPRGVTIHWHGVKQHNNCWADGPAMITQCPIPPNKNFTYRFNVIGQEGTLWWHAHIGFLRATIHGALIIRPRLGPNSYPFPKPDQEITVVLGEWFDMDLFELYEKTENRIYGDIPLSPTINGMLGDFNNCSGVTEDSYKLDVEQGKTYLLRIVNAGVDKAYNLKIAGHKFTVVAADANYVKPYTTDIIAIASGETFDALVVADAPPGRYYMVAQAVQTTEPITQKQVLMSRGIVSYNPMKWLGDDTLEIMAPELPDWHDESPSFYFHGNLTSLLPQTVPSNIDEHMSMALRSGYNCLYGGAPHCTVTMINNISFQHPSTMSLLQAHYYHTMRNISSLLEFPIGPPMLDFNQTRTTTATLVKKLRYNSTVEIVLQGPPGQMSYSNPMHLHGHDFFILAQGLGYYDPEKDVQKYNLVNPPVKNTAHVPMNGWTVIRFVTSNPGVWFFHCHTEHHSSSGMAMAFVVEDGPTVETTLPPPPTYYPSCGGPNSIVEYV
ncbi:laccase-15 [Lolium perenne]|uniref:laccase-15 n=1 Tax=Lolium perenne TaxID=4522 RepID=UPI0021F5D71C|nr:laccase-15-like [Lolium perenne]